MASSRQNDKRMGAAIGSSLDGGTRLARASRQNIGSESMLDGGNKSPRASRQNVDSGTVDVQPKISPPRASAAASPVEPTYSPLLKSVAGATPAAAKAPPVVLDVKEVGNRQKPPQRSASIRLNPADPRPTSSQGAQDFKALCVGDLVVIKVGSGSDINGCVQIGAGHACFAENCGDAPRVSQYDTMVFRICPRLDYRQQERLAAAEANRQDAAAGSASVSRQRPTNETSSRAETDGHLAKRERAASEARQNTEVLAALDHHTGHGLKYGDIIQLEHPRSGKFLRMHKDPATVNAACRKADFGPGQLGAHMRVLPRFKVRTMGTPVYSDDELVLQSVALEPLVLGCTARPSDKFWGASEAEAAQFGLRLPHSMRTGPRFEVSGAFELRSFTMHLYHRPNEDGKKSLLTGVHNFRFFYPESGAYLSASGDADKGEVLDAIDPKKQTRLRGVDQKTPAHVPYLKIPPGDAASPQNASFKSVWCFESLEENESTTVAWRKPYRLRHVASGKYLAVDTLNTTSLEATEAPLSGASSALLGGDLSKRGEVVDEDSALKLFTAALVDAEDLNKSPGGLGSRESMIFCLSPTDEVGEKLINGVNTLRLEHQAASGETVYFVSAREPKLKLTPLTTSTEGSDVQPKSKESQAADAGSGDVSADEILAPSLGNTRGGRILFSTKLNAVDVLKVVPLLLPESFLIAQLKDRINLFHQYTYFASTYGVDGTTIVPGSPHLNLCGYLVRICLDCIGDFQMETRSVDFINDALKKANSSTPQQFADSFTGEPNPVAQKIAVEIKLVDALFAAALAPYNRVLSNARPFAKAPMNELPRVLLKFLYVTLQRSFFSNQAAQAYFCSRSARVWEPKNENSGLGGPTPPLLPAQRKWKLWRDIILTQGEDPFGATVTLTQLLSSSREIVRKLVNPGMIKTFRDLLRRCGPETRLINVFSAICFVEGRPERINQESCLRLLWIDPNDRYGFGVTFHEAREAKVREYGPVKLPCVAGDVTHDGPHMMLDAFNRSLGKSTPLPREFLGKDAETKYSPICIAWSGMSNWFRGPDKDGKDPGALWFSAESMGLKTVEGVDAPKLDGTNLDVVPLEEIMWVLEPERLCKSVTGHEFADKTPDTFKRLETLAWYIVAQVKFLTSICKGRAANCIATLEREFSYIMLMNMCTNPRLPTALRAAVADFAIALYLDRYPQFPNCGAPKLPEELWIFEGDRSWPPQSSTPVVGPRKLQDNDAFPSFFVPTASVLFKDPEPLLSFPEHTKFFLLRCFCDDVVKSFGKDGLMVAGDPLNDLGGAAFRVQENLLNFGFLSTYEKLSNLCTANARLLDGRNDKTEAGEDFSPQEERWSAIGADSVTKVKVANLSIFAKVTGLRTNYRLAKVLQKFKEHSEEVDRERDGKNSDGLWSNNLISFTQQAAVGSDYLLGIGQGENQIFNDVEALFFGGSDDASQLDLKVLSDKNDLYAALVDCLKYKNDTLMARALQLFQSVFSERLGLRAALRDVTLLERPNLPVFGDVHTLRNENSRLIFLARTYSRWAVSSTRTKSFGDAAFGELMESIDKFLVFLHQPFSNEASSAEAKSGIELVSTRPAARGLWTDDVARKWALRKDELPDSTAQMILRTCAIHTVLVEAVYMDVNIAWSISDAVDREESTRRLALVKRALLQLALSFVKLNAKNQEVLFEVLFDLQELATPSGLKPHADVGSSDASAVPSKLALRKASKVDEGVAAKRVWPATEVEYGQAIIIELFQRNQGLCDRMPADIPKFFALIAENPEDPKMDVSIEGSLDFFFPFMKPGGRPDKVSQVFVASILSDQSSFPRLHGACLACFSSHATEVGTESTLQAPERIIRLMSTAVEGGNEEAATRFSAAGVSLNRACLQLVELTNQRAAGDGLGGGPSNALAVLLTPVGAALLELVAELVFVRQLTSQELQRPAIWQFMTEVGGMAAGALGADSELDEASLKCCEDLFDTLERLVTSMAKLGILKKMVSSLEERATVLKSIQKSAGLILSQCEVVDEELKDAFYRKVRSSGERDRLTLEAFKSLFRELVPTEKAEAYSSSSVQRTMQFEDDERNREELFQAADVNKNGTIDIYKFADIYQSLGRGLKGVTISKKGNRLKHRTIACLEQIILAMNGARMNNELTAERHRYSVRQADVKERDKIFVRDTSIFAPEQQHAPRLGTLSERLEAFKKTVFDNKRIIQGLRVRRFTMVEVLEQGIFNESTDSSGSIAWSDLVERFVQYASNHYLECTMPGGGGADGEESARVIKIILNTFQTHLINARTRRLDDQNEKIADRTSTRVEELKSLEVDDLDEDELADYVSKQATLNDLGVTVLLAKITSSFDDISPDGLSDHALELLVEMLNGGNSAVASTLYTYIVELDMEGKFINHLAVRLEASAKGIKEYRDRGFFGVAEATVPTDDFISLCEECIQSSRLLQLCCENHNYYFQELIRDQPMYRSKRNLLKIIIDMLMLTCESSSSVENFKKIEVDLLAQLLSTLTESMMGPCVGNQELVVSSDAIVAVNSIMAAESKFDFEKGESGWSLQPIQSGACVLLASCLEGRRDISLHDQLRQKLDLSPLLFYKENVEKEVREIYGVCASETRLPDDEELIRIEQAQDALISIISIAIELRVDLGSGTTDKKNNLMAKREMAINRNFADDNSLVGVVEVAWIGKIERCTFPLPPEKDYLSQTMKKRFMDAVDLSTIEKRNAELLRTADDIIAELECVHALAETNKMFRFLNLNLISIKMAIYALVVLLNINVVFSPNRMIVPLDTISGLLDGTISLQVLDIVSVFLTYVLGATILAGYVAVSVHQSQIAVPILINDMDSVMEEAKADQQSVRQDPGAFASVKLFAVASLMFCFVHAVNFALNPYFYLCVLILQIPVAIKSYRNYLLVPSNDFERAFCISYDALVEQAFLRNQVILGACTLIGFKYPEFFSLMLLDIVNISPVILDIINSIKSSGTSLAWVLYLFVITNVIYASWGMVYFTDQMVIPNLVDDDTNSTNRRLATRKTTAGAVAAVVTENVECTTIYECFLFMFYQSLSEGGNAKAFLQINVPGLETYLPRIAFDSLFFIWVGIVLMNVITGLMVDTFAATRDEKAERAATWADECFICGLERDEYEGKKLPVDFEKHLSKDHDLWAYVFFVAYLKRRDKTKLNGVESYVTKQMNTMSLEWLPFHTCFAIQDSNDGTESGASEEFEIAEVDKGSLGALEKLESKVEKMAASLDALEGMTGLILEELYKNK